MNAITELWTGRTGLAKAYWGYGVLGGASLGVALSLITPGSAVAMAVVALVVAYLVTVNVGVWRSASKYQGPKPWAVLAKVAVAAMPVILVIGTLSAVILPSNLNRQSEQPVATTQPSVASLPNTYAKDGSPCTEITEFLGECKRQP